MAPISDPTVAMNAVIEDAFRGVANSIIDGVLKMLDVTNLQDPNCLTALLMASSQLPAHYACIAKAKEKLDNLIEVATNLQRVHIEFDVLFEEKNKVVTEAKRMIAGQEEALQGMVREIDSAAKLEAEIMNQITEAQRTLEVVKARKQELLQKHSAQDSEVQRLRSVLREEPDQETKDFQARLARLKNEADELQVDLKNWRS